MSQSNLASVRVLLTATVVKDSKLSPPREFNDPDKWHAAPGDPIKTRTEGHGGCMTDIKRHRGRILKECIYQDETWAFLR